HRRLRHHPATTPAGQRAALCPEAAAVQARSAAGRDPPRAGRQKSLGNRRAEIPIVSPERLRATDAASCPLPPSASGYWYGWEAPQAERRQRLRKGSPLRSAATTRPERLGPRPLCADLRLRTTHGFGKHAGPACPRSRSPLVQTGRAQTTPLTRPACADIRVHMFSASEQIPIDSDRLSEPFGKRLFIADIRQR